MMLPLRQIVGRSHIDSTRRSMHFPTRLRNLPVRPIHGTFVHLAAACYQVPTLQTARFIHGCSSKCNKSSGKVPAEDQFAEDEVLSDEQSFIHIRFYEGLCRSHRANRAV